MLQLISFKDKAFYKLASIYALRHNYAEIRQRIENLAINNYQPALKTYYMMKLPFEKNDIIDNNAKAIMQKTYDNCTYDECLTVFYYLISNKYCNHYQSLNRELIEIKKNINNGVYVSKNKKRLVDLYNTFCNTEYYKWLDKAINKAYNIAIKKCCSIASDAYISTINDNQLYQLNNYHYISATKSKLKKIIEYNYNNYKNIINQYYYAKNKLREKHNSVIGPNKIFNHIITCHGIAK